MTMVRFSVPLTQVDLRKPHSSLQSSARYTIRCTATPGLPLDHVLDDLATVLGTEPTNSVQSARPSARRTACTWVARSIRPSCPPIAACPEMHADGESLNAIARALNAECFATANGKAWHASTVGAIVTGETTKMLDTL